MTILRAVKLLLLVAGSLIILVLIAIIAFRMYLKSVRYISPKDATEYLQLHRADMESLVDEFDSMNQVYFVSPGLFDAVPISVMTTDSVKVYFVASPIEEDERPIWLQPFDSIRDNRSGLNLKEVLDSAGVDRQEFARILELLIRNELYGVEQADGRVGVDIRIRELTGLAYRPRGTVGYSPAGLDSAIQLESEWYWFLKR